MNLQLTDKTALVSGSLKGIGFATASLARCPAVDILANNLGIFEGS